MNQEGIRCGFFNSINNDRKYDAEDMGRLFEGVISDGVFSTVEPKFKVEAVPETMDLLVNNGKAWFHERYFEIYNPITVSIRPTDVNPRIDAICICINTNDSVRAGSIEVVEGSTNKPSMPAEDGVYYIPIAWVTVGPNDTVSTDLDIESNVGNAHDPIESYRCPYSEPTLDPRRAVYAYEGESEIDPSINKIEILESSEAEAVQSGISYFFPYPDGFNDDNVYVVDVQVYHGMGSFWWDQGPYICTRQETGLQVVILNGFLSVANYQKCKIAIMKIEEDQNE